MLDRALRRLFETLARETPRHLLATFDELERQEPAKPDAEAA